MRIYFLVLSQNLGCQFCDEHGSDVSPVVFVSINFVRYIFPSNIMVVSLPDVPRASDEKVQLLLDNIHRR